MQYLIFILTLLQTLPSASPLLPRADSDTSTLLSTLTQPTPASFTSWSKARSQNTSNFNWQTDYCSKSPDQPFGYDFRMACWRHDFGYRNYKAIGEFTDEIKERIDLAFYEDMKRVCGGNLGCKAAAWGYYQAVRAVALRAQQGYPCYYYDPNGPRL